MRFMIQIAGAPGVPNTENRRCHSQFMEFNTLCLILSIAAVVLCAVFFAAGILYRKKVAEKQIGSAEEEAKRIINEAIKGGENKKREMLLEAKEEIHKSRSEYEREVKLGGGTTIYYPLRETDGFRIQPDDFISKLNESIDLLIICNPNNPTSTCITSRQMRRILDACKEHGIFVMIDETYVEFAAEVDKVTAIPLTKYYDNLIILRGTSKFFAAPGLRLGYAVTGNRDLLKNLSTRQNPWSISSLAAIAGEIMFTDQEYIEKTRALISSERTRMYHMLSAHPDYKVYEPSANFLLVKLLREDQTSETLFDKAIRRCMMIRDCSTFPFLDDRYIRFCIMSPSMNDKLMECILE